MAKERHILESEIIDVIKGKGEGYYSGYAYLDFREKYYDRIKDPDDKAIVPDILMNFLKKGESDSLLLGNVAWICADLEIPATEDEIKRLSADKRIKEAPNYLDFKVLLDQFELEKNLIKEIQGMKFEIDSAYFRDFLDRAVELFRKLRGDVSHIYASKGTHDFKEPEFARSMVIERLIRILKSPRYEASIKIRCALVLSDFLVRSATHEIEKLLQNPQVTDASHINLIKQAVAHLKEDYLTKRFGY